MGELNRRWSPRVTLQNYTDVLFSQSSNAGQLSSYYLNSIVITVDPAGTLAEATKANNQASVTFTAF